MRFLLDTCVLSEVRHPKGTKAVKDAIARVDDEKLFVSVLTVGEITKGIALLPPGKKQSALMSWLDQLQEEFGQRLIPIDSDIARVWGALAAKLQKEGIVLPGIDGLIASTALCHGMQLITRNTRDVAATGVLILDPWQR